MKVHGIAVQQPYADLIAKGKKIIETRTYPAPSWIIGKPIALIETPGKSRLFRSRVIAIIELGPSKKYESEKDFYADFDLHKVGPDSLFSFESSKEKWAWPITKTYLLAKPKVLRKRCGIVFTKDINVEQVL